MKNYLLLVMVGFMMVNCLAHGFDTPESVRAMVRNINLPGDEFNALTVDMHMRLPETPVHLFCQLRYQTPGSYSLGVYDGNDNTPLLIVCDQLALINDPFAEKLSVIASAGVNFELVPQEKQYNAVFAFNMPVGGIINNRINLDFTTMFARLTKDTAVAAEASGLVFSGATEENSRCTATLNASAALPLQALSLFIAGVDKPVLEFSRIECASVGGLPTFPLQKLQGSGMVAATVYPEGFIDTMMIMTSVIKAVFARAAIYQPEIRARVSEMLNLSGMVDWQSVRARDSERAGRLRELFPEGANR